MEKASFELLNESMLYIDQMDVLDEDVKEAFEKAKNILIRLIEKLIIVIKKSAQNLRVILSNIKTKVQNGQTSIDISGLDFGGKNFHADDIIVLQQAVKELVRVASSPVQSAVSNAQQLDDKIANVYKKQLFTKKDNIFQINKIDRYCMMLEQIAHDLQSAQNYCERTMTITVDRKTATGVSAEGYKTETHQQDEKEVDSKDAKQMLRNQITNFYGKAIDDYTMMLKQVASYVEEKTTHAMSKERQNFKVNNNAAKKMENARQQSIMNIQNQVRNNPNMRITKATETTYINK